MTLEPRFENQYTLRQIEAARRGLVDIGQVLASFGDAIVVVGGWVPDLLLPDAASAHIGSIDVDLALDAARLADGRYAELLTQILDTGRYERGDKDFQLVSVVDLRDGGRPVRVEVDFVASHEVVPKKNHPKLVEGFRVLRRPAFAAAFTSPVSIGVSGPMVSGAVNTVHLRVASLPDFLVMKAHAIGGRDKPKDVYDLCYCLDECFVLFRSTFLRSQTVAAHQLARALPGVATTCWKAVGCAQLTARGRAPRGADARGPAALVDKLPTIRGASHLRGPAPGRHLTLGASRGKGADEGRSSRRQLSREATARRASDTKT